jgi:hypothetical protein
VADALMNLTGEIATKWLDCFLALQDGTAGIDIQSQTPPLQPSVPLAFAFMFSVKNHIFPAIRGNRTAACPT